MRSYSEWVRRWHVYMGLYFLFFLWLFSVSGLALNHPGWEFAQFWPQRQQSQYERPLRVGADGSLSAGDAMAQIGIRGEVEWGAAAQAPGRLRFRVARPGRLYEVEADIERKVARVNETAVNSWGVMSALHHFNGVRAGDERNVRDWILTEVWVFSMDALAAGVLFVSLSGVWIWWCTGRRRLTGAATVAAGAAVCGVLLWGL